MGIDQKRDGAARDYFRNAQIRIRKAKNSSLTSSFFELTGIMEEK